MLTIEGREITPSRLIRATGIVIKYKDENGDFLPDRHYMVTGKKGNKHYLFTKPYIECDCEDFIYRESVLCKHLIRALMLEKHPIMVRQLQDLGIEV